MVNNPYYTHQKYLTNELNKLDYAKPMLALEFGTGNSSATIFYNFTKCYHNLQVNSYESDYVWYQNIAKKYYRSNYNFHYVGLWDELIISEQSKENNILHYQYDLVFIDTDPFPSRIKLINFIKDNAKIIILHDYDFYNKGVIENIFSVSKGSFFEKEFGDDFIMEGNYEVLPPTLIFKNKNYYNK